jgi:hypothetical protein
MTTVANILTNVGYRLFPDGETTIGASSEPSQAECIQWINETCEELLTVCVEMGSEIGRTAAATVTLADETASYDDLAALLFAPVIYRNSNGAQFSGWIEKTTTRVALTLTTEQELINYNPSLEKEPEKFYIDGSNNLVFIPTPDGTYTAKIPYYGYLTALALTTDTIPFLRVFDNVIIEMVTMRAQNREEYELGFELKWFQYLRGQARKIIKMRKNPTTRISV